MASAYKLVGYFTNWSQYRPDPAEFLPENIDPQLFTHLVYAFATMVDHKITPIEWNDERLYKQFNNLKKQNPRLLTLLAIGGWTFGVAKFTEMVASPDTRQIFIDSVIEYLRKYNFDGIDLDFEYPGARGSPPEDKQRFTSLTQEMLAAFTAEATATHRSRLLMTAAVSASKTTIDTGYEIAEIGRTLDFINVMTYDFHGGWDSKTGHNSPLYRGSKDDEYSFFLNVSYAMNYWRDNGVPAEKLLLGFPTYGRTFTIPNPSICGVGTPVSGAALRRRTPRGRLRGLTSSVFIISANTAPCALPSQIGPWLKGATVEWIADQKVPYACKGNEWVGFDNQQSYEHKVDFLKKGGFGGAMVWAIDLDDFLGSFCNEGKYPLIRHLKSLLEGCHKLLHQSPVPPALVTSPPLQSPLLPSPLLQPPLPPSPLLQPPLPPSPPLQSPLPPSPPLPIPPAPITTHPQPWSPLPPSPPLQSPLPPSPPLQSPLPPSPPLQSPLPPALVTSPPLQSPLPASPPLQSPLPPNPPLPIPPAPITTHPQP
ncbi:acidic mammalian chitinase-like [Ascaphus truei]|uniref:acidic mammalian chitinase-like n=1 Tax=Ascaphus truei TaxID=8439 RepID=UPI003F5A337B